MRRTVLGAVAKADLAPLPTEVLLHECFPLKTPALSWLCATGANGGIIGATYTH